MKKTEKTSTPFEIICVLDRSGSMGEIRIDALSAINIFLIGHREINKNAKITLVLFNHNITMKWNGVPLKQLKELSERSYIPEGMTAMLDAIGTAIAETDARLFDEKSNRNAPNTDVLLAVITDGYENASKIYSHDEIRKLIQSHIEKKWDIIFLTSNEDSRLMAIERLGFLPENVEIFPCTSTGIRESFGKISNAATLKQKGNIKGWKDSIPPKESEGF